ncbi:MAG: TRAP transporter small permease [Fervidobacterium sp.]|uniref:TRAP transporter small permease n=1 Tax=Fervidobacterium sp. TaxID=1871331 RepID=UPI00404AAA37
MRKLNAVLYKVEKLIGKIFLAATSTLIFYSAISRFLGYPANWAVDISLILFAYSAFIAADVAWTEDKMMRVDLFVKKLPERIQSLVQKINYLLIIAFNVYFLVWGVYITYSMRFRKVGGFHSLSYSIVALSVPIGATMLLRTSLIKFIQELRKGRKSK